MSTVKRRLVTRYRPDRTLVEQSAHAQLVVVGSRGCGGFAGLLLGSVSHALSHPAGCPVAMVRPAAPSHALTGAERATAPAYTSALPTSACRGERYPRSTPERTVSDPDRFSFSSLDAFRCRGRHGTCGAPALVVLLLCGSGSGVAGLGDRDRNGRRDTDVRLLPVDRHAGSVGHSGRWGRQPRVPVDGLRKLTG